MKEPSFRCNDVRITRTGKPLIDSPFTTRVPFPLASSRQTLRDRDGPIDLVFAFGEIGNVDATWTDPPAESLIRGLGVLSRVLFFDRRGTGISDRRICTAYLRAAVQSNPATIQPPSAPTGERSRRQPALPVGARRVARSVRARASVPVHGPAGQSRLNRLSTYQNMRATDEKSSSAAAT